MSGKSFKSTGTIRVELTRNSSRQLMKRIFFTPATDSTVRYGDKRYAVFMATKGNDPCFTGRLVRDAGEGVPIDVSDNLTGLETAAIQQTLVQVEVLEEGSFCDFTLLAITIPAPGKQK